MFKNFFTNNRADFKMTWENVVEPEGPQVYVNYKLDN